jgi:hypothetical protein
VVCRFWVRGEVLFAFIGRAGLNVIHYYLAYPFALDSIWNCPLAIIYYVCIVYKKSLAELCNHLKLANPTITVLGKTQ